MKNIKEYIIETVKFDYWKDFINESSMDFTNNTTTQGAFKEKVKYSLSDWNKWKKETKEDVFFGNYETEPDLEVIYIPDHKNKTLKHIATYNKKTNVLFCDDIKLFGHEI